MDTKSIDVEVLESANDFVKVKVPFLEVPVEMSHQFFNTRLETGYFKVKGNPKLKDKPTIN